MESKLIECVCSSEGLHLTDCEEDLLLSVWLAHNTKSLTLWQRIKFVVNQWSVYSEVLLDVCGVKELADYCNEWLKLRETND